MKTKLINGKIYQGLHEYCECLVIEDKKIIYAGNNIDDSADEVIDLKGKTVIPGFNDSHLHLFNLAKTYAQAKIRDCRSKEELIQTCIDYCKNNPDYVRHGMSARGYNNDLFIGDTSMPNKHDLDRILKDQPVVLDRVCGHICCVNTKALEMLDEIYGLNNLPDAEVVKDENGEPTGVLCEYSVFKALELVPDLDAEVKKKLVLEAMNYCVSVGITSVQSNDINDFENETELKSLLMDLYKNDDPVVRYTAQCCFKDFDSYKRILENDLYHFDFENEMFKLGPLKLYKDGSLGARTAELYNDYHDNPGNKGIGVLSQKEMEDYAILSDQYNIQVVTHSIGDKAIDEVANAYIKANNNKENKNRHGIIHCQITDEAILDKIAKNDLLVFYQPIFLEYDIHMVEERVGTTLGNTSYAFNTAKKLNIHTSYGSDCPIEDCNGFYNIHCAVNRQDYDFYPENGYNPKEKMSIEDAIDCFTYESAYAEFLEKEKGLLKQGYYADFLILDEDIFTIDSKKIKDLKPAMTFVNGKMVFKSNTNK